MEFGTIEREIYIDASPDTVYDVVSEPEHVRQWWPDDAQYEPEEGSSGRLVFGQGPDATPVEFTVVDAQPPRLFSFRWSHPAGHEPVSGNSLLVTFDLTPQRSGTLLRMTETGFREMGWSEAQVEHAYRDNVAGWDYYLPRLIGYVASLTSRS